MPRSPRAILLLFGRSFLFFFSFAGSLSAQQVVFSRRVYAPRGYTYQQLWVWSPSNGQLTRLTRSARDHSHPACSLDGTHIFFESGGLWSPTVWQFDRTTRREARVDWGTRDAQVRAPSNAGLRAPACDADTVSQSPDGTTMACTVHGHSVVIVDAATQQERERIPFEQLYSNGQPYPDWPLELTWSPGGNLLLVGTYGENSSSTSTFLDYFLLDVVAHTWTRAMIGNNPVWLPDGRSIIYSTPRDLVPLTPSSEHRVWSAHLARYDLATHTETLLTSGVTNNERPILCGP
jgi:Tol biopolymer transport system component